MSSDNIDSSLSPQDSASSVRSSTSSDYSMIDVDDASPKISSGSSTNLSLNNDYLDDTTFFELLNPSHAELSFKKRYSRVKSKTAKNLTNFTKKQKEKILKTKNEMEIDKLREKVVKRLDGLNDKLSQKLETTKTEKLFYSFSIYSIFFSGIIIGKHPTYFHQFYTILSTILLPIRYLTYWKNGNGYFLADICYYVNLLVLSFIWLFPGSKHLYLVCFAFTFGTLAWAVITWRNSLVLHSIEKTTSLFIHLTPGLVLYVITHQLPESYKEERFPGAAGIHNWNLVGGILWTSLYYLVWQSFYHYFITIKRADKIKAGRVTSFSYLRKAYSNKPLGKFVNSLPDPLPVLLFTLLQYFYQLITMMLCPIWFKYKHLAACFMSFIFIWASYNGATYYIDIFGKKFEKEVVKLREEIASLQDQENKDVESYKDK